MLIFIDESGINKQENYSTFVLAYIEAQYYSQLERQIITVEKNLQINGFHWAHTVWKVKEEFMDAVLGLDFKAKIAVVKNPVSPVKELERVVKHMIIERNIRSVYIDGKKPKWYERRMKGILRDKGISVHKLRTVEGARYAGIRLADMVAGLSRSYFDGKNKQKISKYYKRLEKKIVVIVE